ncbi:hypothetical protein ES708_11973 [subsurface metagenome]
MFTVQLSVTVIVQSTPSSGGSLPATYSEPISTVMPLLSRPPRAPGSSDGAIGVPSSVTLPPASIWIVPGKIPKPLTRSLHSPTIAGVQATMLPSVTVTSRPNALGRFTFETYEISTWFVSPTCVAVMVISVAQAGAAKSNTARTKAIFFIIKPSFLLFFAELHTLHCLDFYIGYEQVTNFAHALSFPADWRKCVPCELHT